MRSESVYRPVDGIEINRVPDGAMVYVAERMRVHFLSPTALVVFELCGMGKSVAEIETFLADAFSLPSAPSESVRSCLRSLLDEGLVFEWSPSSAAP